MKIEEFITKTVHESNLTKLALWHMGYGMMPCGCGSDDCTGWQMVREDRMHGRTFLFEVVFSHGKHMINSQMLQLQNKVFRFTYGWVQRPHEKYGLEIAWLVDDAEYPETAPMWIASGDLRYVSM